jgi:TRAP-type C4-dicarboxylate transport system permease small subunit
MKELIARLIPRLNRIENFILAASFSVMTLAAFAQVVNRNVVHAGVPWFEELARYCMIYMALLGTEIGLRDGSQIAITAVIDKFRGVPRALLDIFGKLVIVVFSAAVFWHSLPLLQKQIQFGQLSPGLRVPMYVPYAALPLSFGIITVVQAAALCALFASLFSGNGKAAQGGAA